ncbi:MAG: hypothetical protein O3A00_13940 [Planctomycetota bacterium]|nr:hypothetical protein [Planctomycetota bacterium]
MATETLPARDAGLEASRIGFYSIGTLKLDGNGIVYNFIPDRSIDGMWLDVEGESLLLRTWVVSKK